MRGRTLRTLIALSVTLVPAAVAQQFGGSIAFGGDQILVGESRNVTMSGIVYVYGERSGRWSEVDQIAISDQVRDPDGFGQALAADGDVFLAGAPLARGGSGAVYAFEADGSGGWTQAAVLSPDDLQADARFGSAISMAGDRVVVSAPGIDGAPGSVYAFRRADDGSWRQTDRLAPTDPEEPGFGTALTLAGEQLLVTTRAQRGAAAMVHAFRLDVESNRWSPRGTLSAEQLPERSEFGAAIGLFGDFGLVGAPGVNDRTGVVFVFGYDEETAEWAVVERLGPLVANRNALFGRSIFVDGPYLAVGAPGSTNGTGSFYEFDRGANGSWSGTTLVETDAFVGGAQVGQTLAVHEDVAVVGAAGVDSGSGAVLILTRGAGGNWVEQVTLANEMRGFPALTGEEVECVDSRAAAFECRDVNVLSFLPIKDLGGTRGTRVNDIWGWTDSDTGREYAIVGRTNGTAFVDISDPYQPRFLGDLPATEGSRHTIWRDMKVFRDHVYIVADAALEHGVQVFDLRQLRDVGANPVTFEMTYLYDGIHSAHNIVINEETGFAYAVGNSGGGETCGGGLHMIDLNEPSHPVFAGCFAQEGTGRRGTGYAHDAQCVIYHGPDTEHVGKEICLGSNETALSIADVTDKAAPVGLATISYPNVAYAHQGWLTEDHRFFYMNDEGDEPQGLVAGTRTLVWDVADLDDPVLVKEHIAETTATDHNLYVVGDLMYQSNYSAGFRVLDISDPTDPVEIGFLDTSPYEGGASWSNYPFFKSGTIAVTGTGDGLFLLKNMARPRLVP